MKLFAQVACNTILHLILIMYFLSLQVPALHLSYHQTIKRQRNETAGIWPLQVF